MTGGRVRADSRRLLWPIENSGKVAGELAQSDAIEGLAASLLKIEPGKG